MTRMLVLLMVALSGCEEPPPPTPEPAPTTTTKKVKPAMSCADRVKLMRQRLLDALKREPVGFGRSERTPRFNKEVGRPTRDAPVVQLDATRILVDGQLVGDSAELLDILERKRELWRSFHPKKPEPNPWRINVVADPTMTLRTAIPLLTDTHQAGWATMLIVRLPNLDPIETNPPPWLQKELAKARAIKDLPTKLEVLSDANAKAVGSCEAARDIYGGITRMDPSLKAHHLAGKLPGAVEKCRCKLDVDALEAISVDVLSGGEARFAELPLRLDDKAEAHNFAPTDTMQQLATMLAARPSADIDKPYPIRLKTP